MSISHFPRSAPLRVCRYRAVKTVCRCTMISRSSSSIGRNSSPALSVRASGGSSAACTCCGSGGSGIAATTATPVSTPDWRSGGNRSEEHTSELQSLAYLVCRLLLEKKKKILKKKKKTTKTTKIQQNDTQ